MRAQGFSFASIAETVGYADASGASKAYHRALARKPAQNVDQIRAQEAERLEYLWKRASEVIEDPPLVHSAIGKVVPDPRPGREGLFLVDERAKIAAITEYRHLSESYRKMTGADITVKQPDPDEEREMAEFRAWILELEASHAENRVLRAEVAQLRVALAEALAVEAEVVG